MPTASELELQFRGVLDLLIQAQEFRSFIEWVTDKAVSTTGQWDEDVITALFKWWSEQSKDVKLFESKLLEWNRTVRFERCTFPSYIETRTSTAPSGGSPERM